MINVLRFGHVKRDNGVNIDYHEKQIMENIMQRFMLVKMQLRVYAVVGKLIERTRVGERKVCGTVNHQADHTERYKYRLN